MKYIFSFTFLIFTYLNSVSQEYPQDYFQSPLDIPLLLSGNFGELRSNHFHAGLDIKTQGVEGKKVYAVADGYVSRIKVSPYGYGNALYITHPNGYTSVYGHLKKYNETIGAKVKDYQYRKESFAVELFPSPFQLQVKKGDIIAYSGNSGGSGGPHLHFEIRKTATEHPYNPLFFGFDVKDAVKPVIYAVTIYPLNDSTTINGVNQKKRYLAKSIGGNYVVNSKYPIKVNGTVGFGIETVDKMSLTSNRYGAHNIRLKMNEEVIYEQEINEFAFHEGRYLNSHIDYETYRRTRRRVQKSFPEPGNRLRFYKKKEGKIELAEGEEVEMTYVVSDLNGNSSDVTFNLIGSSKVKYQGGSDNSDKDITYMPFNQRNTLLKSNLLVDFPKGVLYKDTYFEFEEGAATSKTISPIYWLHKFTSPLHSYITVSIKLEDISKKLKDKALIVSTTNGRSWYAEGGKWNGNNISVKTRSLGGYAIAVDTIKPKVTPINIYQNANMSKKWSISVKATDNLSGINYFRGTVDGKWVLMEYDAKNNLFSYYFDENVSAGKHNFKFTVSDGVGNSTSFSADFIR